VGRPARRVCLLLALASLACGEGSGSTAADDEGALLVTADFPAEVGETAAVPKDRAGTFEMEGKTHAFLVVQCDLTGSSEDGMLLRGTGTLPDGRRLSVEVERLASGETVNERATVYFGGLIDGDHWTARAIQWPDGRWFADEIGSEVTEGPLIRVSGNEVAAEGAYQHERDDSTKRGRVHATCPA